jgi:peptidoglycan/LPS O-acetylase OafA/YrhL
MIRDRFALACAGLAATGLMALAALAMNDAVRRNVDVTVLWLAGALTIGLVATWVFLPRLPKWIVAGWGLILIALGIGVIITAPVPAGAGQFPWALIGLVVFGLVIVVTAVVHSGSRATS